MPRFNQIGRVHEYHGMKFWATNGEICLTDKDGSFKVLSCSDFKERWAALRSHVKALLAAPCQTLSDRSRYEEARDVGRLVELMELCWREAEQEQGDHNNPQVSAWFCRHRPWATSRTRAPVGIPGHYESPAPGPLPVHNPETGRIERRMPRTANTDDRYVLPSAQTPQAPSKLILPGK